MAGRNIYRYKTTPYKHQVAALKNLLDRKWGGALLMAPRTGKTKTLIDYASILYQAGRINRVLILCPVSVLGVWEQEFKTHCPVKYRLLVWDRDARKQYKLPRYGDDCLDIVVMNYDSLSTPGRPYVNRNGDKVRSKTRGGRFDIYKQLNAWNPQLIALDESHRIKTSSAKKTHMIHKLAPSADYRVIMTGTVVTKAKRVADIWPQWKFLNPERFGDMTAGEFKHHYGRWIPKNGYELWVANNDLGELHDEIHKDSYAISREECFDLPARMPPKLIPVKLVESAQAYDDMAERMIHEIATGEVTEASLRIVQALRLRQITSGVAKTEPTAEYPEGRLHRVGSEKTEVLTDLLSDLIDDEEKVVIAAHFIHDIKAVEEVCKKLKVQCFPLYGAIARRQRDINIKAFRDYQGPAIFVMQPQAGSLGIDLSTAGTFIWYSLTSSYVDYTQSEDRIALNAKGTTFIYLIAEGTVDEKLYEVLQYDGDIARAIMESPELLRRRLT